MDSNGEVTKDDMNAIIALLADSHAELVEAVKPIAALREHYQRGDHVHRQLGDLLALLSQPRKPDRWATVVDRCLIWLTLALGLWVGYAARVCP